MENSYIIKQLRFRKGKPMCHKPDGRSWQQAHYKQGDLDSACGAYSIAMALNLIGVFDADVFLDAPSEDNWLPYLTPCWHGRSNFKHRYIASKNSKVGVFAALSVGRK